MQYFKHLHDIHTACLGYLLRMDEQKTEGLTVYDSTGLAIEDLALAQYVFENS